MDKIKGGSALITRALELEKEDRWSEALICYQEGIQICMEYNKVAPDNEKRSLREKIEKYMTRAEKIKTFVDKQLKYHKEILIGNDSTGYSYETIFGSYFSDDVKAVKVEDSYIQKHHQLINFLRFCELAVKKCGKLEKIVLVTKSCGEVKQEEFFISLKENLRERNIEFCLEFSNTIHDRQITLSNGWVFLPGRGLDYFKAPKKMNSSIGSYDLDLRPCHETKINIHFRPDAAV